MTPTTVLLVFLAFLSANAAGTPSLSDQATMNFTDYVTAFNYPVETHYVLTEDGYELTVFRIQAKNTKMTAGKPVILFWHGLFDSSDTWIINDESLAPAFIYANQGHDIWLGNSRGNKYSLTHQTLDTSTSAFWAFSWQQMYQRDLPAAFYYISELTGEKINYIGHSQGTTQMFAALSDPDGKNANITNNLRKFAALGPVTYLAHTESKLFKILDQTPFIALILGSVFKHGIFMPNWATTEGGHILCSQIPIICSGLISLLADVHPEVDNHDRLGVLGGHFPAGTSVQDLLHWKQTMDSDGKFQKFDYGAALNLQYYGQASPPLFDPTVVTEDIGMFVGNWDELADAADERNWFQAMINAKKQIHFYDIGHLSFLLGKEMPFIDDLTAFLDLKN